MLYEDWIIVYVSSIEYLKPSFTSKSHNPLVIFALGIFI